MTAGSVHHPIVPSPGTHVHIVLEDGADRIEWYGKYDDKPYRIWLSVTNGRIAISAPEAVST